MMDVQKLALILLVVLPYAGLIATLRNLTSSIERKLDRVNAKLDLIAKANNIDVDPLGHFSPRVRQAIADGKKIEAIKRFREDTGLGLRDAKEAIDKAMP